MIRVNPSTSSLNTREYFSTKFTKTAAPSLVLSAGSCCVGCVSDLPAIANLTDPSDEITNDKTKLPIIKKNPSSPVVKGLDEDVSIVVLIQVSRSQFIR